MGLGFPGMSEGVCVGGLVSVWEAWGWEVYLQCWEERGLGPAHLEGREGAQTS